MIDRYVVYWLNPSDVWQVAYDGPDEATARVTAGAYEAHGQAVDAWLHDDAAGWRLEAWNRPSGEGGTQTGAPPEPTPPAQSSNLGVIVGGVLLVVGGLIIATSAGR
jgi:hypothetical protein